MHEENVRAKYKQAEGRTVKKNAVKQFKRSECQIFRLIYAKERQVEPVQY